MKGYKTYRHSDNPKEKEIHDKFIEKFINSMDLLVFPPLNGGLRPSDHLSQREERIVLSIIQWLGSPIGKDFLKGVGFAERS